MRFICGKRSTKPRKTYFNVGERQKMKSRAELRNYYNLISADIETRYGLKIKKIEFIDKARTTNAIDLVIFDNHESLTNNKIEIYKAKESTNLSDKSFQKFFDSGANFPTLFTAKKYQLRLNSLFETKINSKGYYFEPEKKILFYLTIFKNFININDNIIRIRIAADGTQIGKNLTVLNISFAFLNEIKFPENKSEIYFFNYFYSNYFKDLKI